MCLCRESFSLLPLRILKPHKPVVMDMQRKNIPSGAPWEEIVGYSRAVQMGPFLEIAGTTATENGKVVHRGDAAAQTRFILENIRKVLEENGFSLADVVRTRLFVTHIEHWEAIGRAHGEFFRDIKPAATMVEVSRLIDRDMLVEIEISAIKG